MLQNLNQLYGCKLGAADGDIGHVKDFLFDDQTWVVRYLVADTGAWLRNRLIVFTPHAFGLRPFGISPGEPGVLRVSLNRQKIEEGPVVAAPNEITREDEEAYYDYHRLQVYWRPGNVKGEPAFPTHIARLPGTSPADSVVKPEPTHLHGTTAMNAYQVCASDGKIGAVRGLLVDDKTWALTEIEVATGPWYARKHIVVRPDIIERVSHLDRTIFVKVTRRDARLTMRGDVAQAGAGYR